MKTKFTILLLLIASICYSQSKGINYKALIKDGSNNVLANQNITVQFIILEGAVNVYQETHTPITDANGVIIINIGEGTPISGGYDDLNWGSDNHFLNVQIDTGSGLTDMGTTEFKTVPYALHAANVSGLEAINEGSGIGWRLLGANPDNYGVIGWSAMDLSIQELSSTTKGATAPYSVAMGYGTSAIADHSTAMGYNTIASGVYSTAIGYSTEATGVYATAIGNQTDAVGDYSTALGFDTQADGDYSTAIGKFAWSLADNSTAIGLGVIADDANSMAVGMFNDPNTSATTLFQVGNGTSEVPSNAFTVFQNGTITAPSFDIGEITDNKALITKEYADANYNPTGLEALAEGNGLGWRLIGQNPDNYGIIGFKAIDFSYSNVSSNDLGATGQFSVAFGLETTAFGVYSAVFGSNSSAIGNMSLASGYDTSALGFASFSTGWVTKAEAFGSTAIGLRNIGGGNINTWVATDPVFEVGNGNGAPSNALTVLKNGTITAPSFDMFEITDPKALITKEYADANYLGGGGGTAPSGLEAIDEGNGIGWRLIGSDPTFYGTIGPGAVDLSISEDPSDTNGATGNNSFAIGGYAEAFGNHSIAIGSSSQALTNYTIAIGRSATASGAYATAIGQSTTASAINATALGKSTTASNSWATAMGVNSTASGAAATATGANTTALGWYSFTSGWNTLASEGYSVAMGQATIASGLYSFAMGNQTKAEAVTSTAIGQFNVGGGIGTIYDPTDPIFEIGNGTTDVNRSNAFTVFRNGNATLEGILTQNSDRRLKTNIAAIPYGLNSILQLNPVSYNWKKQSEQSRQSLGLIAQEVQPLIKEIVKVGIDKDQTLSLSYIELIPVLIKAIQEQQDIINKQGSTINGLTAELEQLKKLDQRIKQLEALTIGQQ